MPYLAVSLLLNLTTTTTIHLAAAKIHLAALMIRFPARLTPCLNVSLLTNRLIAFAIRLTTVTIWLTEVLKFLVNFDANMFFLSQPGSD
jgi:hypothetical protein